MGLFFCDRLLIAANSDPVYLCDFSLIEDVA